MRALPMKSRLGHRSRHFNDRCAMPNFMEPIKLFHHDRAGCVWTAQRYNVLEEIKSNEVELAKNLKLNPLFDSYWM